MDTAIVARPAQKAISIMPAQQRNEWLLKQLMVLAEARGADVSTECFELYATALSDFADADIREQIKKVAYAQIGEFEKPWPRLGDLLEPLRFKRRRRIEQEQQEQERQEGIRLFWENIAFTMEKSGCTEAELLERFPNMKGTKPDGAVKA